MPDAGKAFLADWTIMVFLNAKNDLEPHSFDDFEQMAKVGSTNRVNILVEYGRPLRHRVADPDTSRYGGWSTTMRFRVAKGMEPTEDAAVEDLGQVDMGSGAALADFVKWGWTNYPARRTMLVCWDHGHVWARGRLNGSWRYVSHDEDTGNKLYIRSIQDTLTELAPLGKIDVIGFDACLMGMLETAYALRDCGSVMVGSEELEPAGGWSYDRFLAPLVADPRGVEPADLGRMLVDAYRSSYGDGEVATLSAIDLTKVAPLAAAVSEFATTVGTEDFPALNEARKACRNYGSTFGLNSVDLGHFLGEVQRVSGVASAVVEAATSATAALADAVIANYASSARQGEFGSTGLGIYFPGSHFEFHGDPDCDAYRPGNTVFPVEFVDREKWVDFVHSYLTWISYPT